VILTLQKKFVLHEVGTEVLGIITVNNGAQMVNSLFDSSTPLR